MMFGICVGRRLVWRIRSGTWRCIQVFRSVWASGHGLPSKNGLWFAVLAGFRESGFFDKCRFIQNMGRIVIIKMFFERFVQGFFQGF